MTGDVEPSVLLTSAESADISDSLLYYAVIPPEGWSEITIHNVDIRDRFAEITRLDVYGLETRIEPDNRSGAFSRCCTSCSLLPSQASSTAGPQQSTSGGHSDSGGSSAAVIGGVVAAVVCLLAIVVALFFFPTSASPTHLPLPVSIYR